jgi:hypothetical protein
MTEKINDFFNKGIVFECFQAERNILIWKYVADEVEFLKKQDHHIQSMYSFIQFSAQMNFILSLAKIFDNPSKKYPTRCILSFLDIIDENSQSAVEIIETTNTIRLLKENNCSLALINSVLSEDKSLFVKLFSNEYKERFKDLNLQNDISQLKILRDKVVAHNEDVGELSLPFDVTQRLIDFTSEIISIFGMAYHSSVWQTENISFIKINAERNAYFIKNNIDILKIKVPNNS